MDTSNLLIFIISAFALGVVIIMTRDRIPAKMRRGLAITATIMVALAFCLIIYSFLVI
ncbi:mannose/fructose/N-acetylgalactosamine-specific phosphotransferase system component IIC [Fontibacillus solani]|uniref:Mannose/fructose/N-acetylgalactosamine-specific phosphotransferase system component IIC n=1 Tax=Fontibacillus solani TaxID=1572857 RepID=A0A7W3XSA5_9BACL|nr:hypothetical protein [Fontibacillus solani]MBA9086315.1 mannose/fructose/N-acetylgalactosamine-specific phosphotransferase system component IIC [Fontibacillus solani]